jgi:hypothetical protein
MTCSPKTGLTMKMVLLESADLKPLRGGMTMEIKYDSKDQPYIEVGNIRISLIHKGTRDRDKNWTGTHVLRIQAYREDGGLFPGPEYPVDGCNDACELSAAINYLFAKEYKP